MSIEITSASRKEQRAKDIAAAVFVITHDEIRRSGMTTIPELLRLAPGVNVAQFNASNWAVSVRGFNGLYANKLLVLVDGRSVYSRIFSGVCWDAEDMIVDDIERIEVIRGPGAAIWGANAVNGVINIVTKAAAETQGGLVSVEAGGWGQQGAVRYGGAVGSGNYRVYAQWSDGMARRLRPAAPPTTPSEASFRASGRTGLRRPGCSWCKATSRSGRSHPLWFNLDPLTVGQEPIREDRTDAQSGHLLSRWTHTRRGGASLQVQSFVYLASRQEPIADYHRRTIRRGHAVPHAVGRTPRHRYRHRLPVQRRQLPGRARLLAEPRRGPFVAVHRVPPGRSGAVRGSGCRDAGKPGAIRPRLRRRRPADCARHVEGAPPAAALGGRLPRPAHAVTLRAGAPRRVPAGPDRRRIAPRGQRAGQPRCSDRDLRGRRRRLPAGDWDERAALPRRRSLAATDTCRRRSGRPRSSSSRRDRSFASRARSATCSRQRRAGSRPQVHWSPAPAWRLDASYTALRVTPHLSPLSQDPEAGQADGSAPRQQWQLRSDLLARFSMRRSAPRSSTWAR